MFIVGVTCNEAPRYVIGVLLWGPLSLRLVWRKLLGLHRFKNGQCYVLFTDQCFIYLKLC